MLWFAAAVLLLLWVASLLGHIGGVLAHGLLLLSLLALMAQAALTWRRPR